jgi:undecaprenyl-diphosphatase
MEIIWGLLLGAVQGLTEFIPVSSSGHLVIMQSLIPGFDAPGIILEVILHAATTLAILIYFRKGLVQMIKKYYLYLIIASIPAAVAGLYFIELIELMFTSSKLVGLALIVTAGFNFVTNKTTGQKKKLNKNTAILIGIAQAFAIIPGISRSGSTIYAAVRQGIKPKEAAQFSFVLSIPAILGANLVEFTRHPIEAFPDPLLVVSGFISSFVFGVIAIKIVLKFLEERKFNFFAVYCLFVGLILLLF